MAERASAFIAPCQGIGNVRGDSGNRHLGTAQPAPETDDYL